MQCVKFFQDQRDKAVTIGIQYCWRRAFSDRLLTRRLRTSYDRAHGIGQFGAVAQAESVRRNELLTYRDILLALAFVGPYENIAQQLDAIEFIYGDHAVHVSLLRHIDKRQRAKIVANQRDICGKA